MADEIPGLVVRVEATVAKFDASLKKAQAVLNRGADGMERRARKLNTELENVGRNIGNNGMRQGLQNVGFQVQDFAVQVAAGTSATQALSQQLPQLLSGFGLLGVALGTATAIFAPLIGSMLGAGNAAKEFDASLKTLGEALAAYEKFSAIAGSSETELAEKYGTATEAARAFAEQLSVISKDQALLASADLIERFKNSLAEFSIVGLGSDNPVAAVDAIRDNIIYLNEQMNLTTAEAGALTLAFRDAFKVETAQEFIATIDRIVEIINQSEAGYKAIPPELQKLIDKANVMRDLMIETVGKVGDLGHTTNAAVSAADALRLTWGSVVGAVDNAAEAAKRFVAAYAEAQIAKSNAMQLQAIPPAGLGQVTKPVGSVVSEYPFSVPLDRTDNTGAVIKTPGYAPYTAKKTGGGGDSKSEYERETKAVMDRIAALKVEIATYGMSEAAKARYRVETELIAAAEKDGLEVSDERRKQIEELGAATEAYVTQLEAWAEAEEYAREKQAAAMEAAERGNTTLADTASTLIDAAKGANSFADALQNVAIELLKMATQGLLNQGPLASLLGGFLGLGGYSASGSIGGTLGTGGVSPVFSAAPAAPALAGAGGGGGGGFAPVINIDARFATEGTAEMVEKRVSRAVSDIARNIGPMIRASQKQGRP